MSILLLCKGDENAKDLLRNSITTHYGDRPLAFDAVHIHTSGRILHRIGPLTLWLSLELDTYFQFPFRFRQDYQLSLLKIPVLKQSESFDSNTYYLKNRNSPATSSIDNDYLKSVKQRLWAYSAMMLMPLSETFVELNYVDDSCIIAHNTQTEMSAKVCFYPNHQLKEIVVSSRGRTDLFRIALSEETDLIDGKKVYKHLVVGWNDQTQYTLHTKQVDFIEKFEDSRFTLE